MLKLGNKTAKTNPDRAQLFAESVVRNFSKESHLVSKLHFDQINKFMEAHSCHFTPLNPLNDISADTDDESDLVVDVDSDTLIHIHYPREIISTVCDFPYKIIEKCFW